MKTEHSTIVSSTTSKSFEKKSTKTFETAARDKENLVRVSRVLRSTSGPLKAMSKEEMSGQIKIETTNEKTKKITEVGKVNKKSPAKKVSQKSASQRGKIKIKHDDLTTEAEPSENYYKVLAEKTRIALDNALEEKHILHDKIKQLEEENRSYKEMLDESRALVEVLQEMLGEDQPDINNSLDDSVL